LAFFHHRVELLARFKRVLACSVLIDVPQSSPTGHPPFTVYRTTPDTAAIHIPSRRLAANTAILNSTCS
jgi:hypothetical protein